MSIYIKRPLIDQESLLSGIAFRQLFMLKAFILQHILDLVFGIHPARRNRFGQFIENRTASTRMLEVKPSQIRTADPQRFDVCGTLRIGRIGAAAQYRRPAKDIAFMQMGEGYLWPIIWFVKDCHHALQNKIQMRGFIALIENHRPAWSSEGFKKGKDELILLAR